MSSTNDDFSARPAQAAQLLSADNNVPTSLSGATEAEREPATPTPGAVSGQRAAGERPVVTEGVPVPRGQQSTADGSPRMITGVKFPYDDADRAATYLDERMSDEQFLKLVGILNTIAGRRRPAAAAGRE
ncbi:hypothetical protein [Streptomyces sp. NPDC048188]|uniref:hypothetical protein n=1 Tax=Streptomyces sp. NPDC048188 TaxID=3155749 RepID=UPI0034264F5E